jgi:hypothetical protein
MARKFVSRKIKDGRVQVNRHTYIPEDRFHSYDGRLDNMTFVFYWYENCPEFICLWGTEEAFASDDENYVEPTPPYIVDGALPWLFWKMVPNE